MNTEAFEQYINLRDSLDNRISELYATHSDYVQCKHKCSSCCINFGILAVEKYYILHAIENSSKYTTQHEDETCAFLWNNSCSIYAHRPFICRTQGLPIVYLQEDTGVYELSVCELNFKNIDMSYFTEENCLFMDFFNSELYKINQLFIAKNKELFISENDLFDLNTL